MKDISQRNKKAYNFFALHRVNRNYRHVADIEKGSYIFRYKLCRFILYVKIQYQKTSKYHTFFKKQQNTVRNFCE